jgi:hypothetical protein
VFEAFRAGVVNAIDPNTENHDFTSALVHTVVTDQFELYASDPIAVYTM